MIITWIGDTTGLDLKPTWEVESAQVHLVRGFRLPDGGMADTFVLHVRTTEDQMRMLRRDFGESISTGILGLGVLPIRPGYPVWTWNPPSGYALKPGNYTGFNITDGGHEPIATG
jgi:hypothetical protein